MSTRDDFELKPTIQPKINLVKAKKQKVKKKKDNQRKERKATQTLAIVLGKCVRRNIDCCLPKLPHFYKRTCINLIKKGDLTKNQTIIQNQCSRKPYRFYLVLFSMHYNYNCNMIPVFVN